MPGWRMRVYVEDTTKDEKYTIYKPVRKIVLRKLDNIGVEIIRLDNITAGELQPDLWPLLIADDSNVERYVWYDIAWDLCFHFKTSLLSIIRRWENACLIINIFEAYKVIHSHMYLLTIKLFIWRLYDTALLKT